MFFGVFATVDCMATTCVWYYYLCLKGVVIDARLLAWTPACCLMVVLGAKVFHWAALGRKFLVEPSKYLGETGYYVQGGILGRGVDPLDRPPGRRPRLVLADGLCWGAALGQFFGRLGCYNYGCCFGKRTSAWVGVRYTNRDSKILRWRPDLQNVAVHPTQLYTAAANLLLFLILCTAVPQSLPDGGILCAFLLWHGLTRLVIEHFRQDVCFPEGRNWTTFVGAVAMTALAAVLVAANFIRPQLPGPASLVMPYGAPLQLPDACLDAAVPDRAGVEWGDCGDLKESSRFSAATVSVFV